MTDQNYTVNIPAEMLQHNGVQYDPTGEVRPACIGDYIFDGWFVTNWVGENPSRQNRIILRPVGPVEPEPEPTEPTIVRVPSPPSIPLRDWFAGQALTGMLTDPEVDESFKGYADIAYDIADAMLAQCQK